MMKRSLCSRAWVACLMAMMSAAVWAHHSTAAYDYGKSMTLQGTVKEFQWTNPHMFIHVLVPNAQGQLVEWNIECGTPNINVRHGWKSSDIKSGDKVTLTIHGMRDGSMAGTLDSITLPDGRVLYGPAHDIALGPDGRPRAPAQAPPPAGSTPQ